MGLRLIINFFIFTDILFYWFSFSVASIQMIDGDAFFSSHVTCLVIYKMLRQSHYYLNVHYLINNEYFFSYCCCYSAPQATCVLMLRIDAPRRCILLLCVFKALLSSHHT